MIIQNETQKIIKVDGRIVRPNTQYERFEGKVSTVTIYSEIGTSKITTKESERIIENNGNLIAIESDDRVDLTSGLKVIVVKEK